MKQRLVDAGMVRLSGSAALPAQDGARPRAKPGVERGSRPDGADGLAHSVDGLAHGPDGLARRHDAPPAHPIRREAPDKAASPVGGQAAFWACYEAEFRWFALHASASDGVAFSDRVACLLAARTATSSHHIRAFQAPADNVRHPFAHLLATTPDPASLPACLQAAGLPGPPTVLDAEEMTVLARLWTLAASTESLLAGGGDERLALDPATRLNRYHCAPWPRPEIVSFGSCTASSLSEAAFAAAARARHDLIVAAMQAGTDQAVAQACRHVEAAILSHYQVADLAGAVLTASGTDAALVVTALLGAEHPGAALTSILVSAAETGSGVPDAVQARHFAGLAPGGRRVAKGEPLAGLVHAPRLAAVALRDAAGRPLSPAEMEVSCASAIAEALAFGRAVLHAIDGSKTGLAAPDKPALLRLRRRFGAALDIVIDACQARIEAADMRWYLQHGFPVMVTGSKFFTAPGFCGAVLVPRARLEAIGSGAGLPAGLAAYACLDGGVGSRRCASLVLRWAAALHEMAAFAAHDPDLVARRLDDCASALRRAAGRDGRFALLPAPRPPAPGWSGRQSVFTFTMQDGQDRLGADRLRGLYTALQDASAGAGCQVGQPVLLGGAGLAGLRVAFSAAQLGGEAPVEQVGYVLGRLGSML